MEWEPIGFVSLDEKSEEQTVCANFKRPAKYIYLRPVNFRSKPVSYTKEFHSSSLELQFFAVQGQTQDRISEEVQAECALAAGGCLKGDFSVDVKKLLSGVDVEVLLQGAGESSAKWVKIEEMRREDVQVREEFLQNVAVYSRRRRLVGVEPAELAEKMMSMGISVDASLKLSVGSSLFGHGQVQAFRVCVRREQISACGKWDLSAVSVQAHKAMSSCRLSALYEGLGLGHLRSCMTNVALYDRLVKQLVQLVQRKETTKNHLEVVFPLLGKIIDFSAGFAPCVCADLDLYAFLQKNIVSKTEGSYQCVFAFIARFIHDKRFLEGVCKSLLRILQELTASSQVRIKELGLRGVFKLLHWCYRLNQGDTFAEIFNQISLICAKINECRNPLYNVLRINFKNAHLCLEKDLFSACAHEDRPLAEAAGQASGYVLPLKSLVAVQNCQFTKKMVIDLLGVHAIEQLKLTFNQTSAFKPHFWLKVWSVDPQTHRRVLLHSKRYLDATFVQLASHAYKNEVTAQLYKGYANLEKLGCAGFSGLQTRYLIMQVSWSLHTAASTLTEEKNCPKNYDVIPEVYGQQISAAGRAFEPELKKFFCDFSAAQIQFESDFFIDQSHKYDKLKVTDAKARVGTMQLFIYDSIGLYMATGRAQALKESVLCSEALEAELVAGSGQGAQASQQAKVSEKTELCHKIAEEQSQLQSLLGQYYEVKYLSESISLMNAQQQQLEKLQIPSLRKSIKEKLQQIQKYQQQLVKCNACLQASTEFDKTNLSYLYTLARYYCDFLKKCLREQSSKDKEFIKTSQILRVCAQLFETFIVYEDGPLSAEALLIINELTNNCLQERDWQAFVFDVIQLYLQHPQPFSKDLRHYYNPIKVINALDAISIPLGEVLTYLALKLKLPLDHITKSAAGGSGYQQQLSPEGKKQRSEGRFSQIIPFVQSALMLLNKGYKNIPLEISDPLKIQHKGAYCFSCQSNKSIVGPRYKCVNCPNLDSCASAACQNKHLQTHPDHTFAIIEQPLPLAPDRQNLPFAQPLLPILDFQVPYTTNHKVVCQHCAQRIEDIRYMCSNCDDYSICKVCYEEKKVVHINYHVFLKLDKALQIKEGQAPKKLIQVLDPLLYPMRQRTEVQKQIDLALQKKISTKGISREIQTMKESQDKAALSSGQPAQSQPILQPGMKRSTSHPVNIEESESQSVSQSAQLTIIEEEAEI